jgi:hypothetical protein
MRLGPRFSAWCIPEGDANTKAHAILATPMNSGPKVIKRVLTQMRSEKYSEKSMCRFFFDQTSRADIERDHSLM